MSVESISTRNPLRAVGPGMSVESISTRNPLRPGRAEMSAG
jgi:hypothetical protein